MALVGKVRMDAGRDAMVRRGKGRVSFVQNVHSPAQSSPAIGFLSFVIRAHDA